MRHYIDMDRDAVAQRRRARDAYASLDGVLGVRGCGRHALTLTDKRGSWSYSKIGPGPRRQLMRLDEAGRPAGPLWLWLNEAGLPLEPSSWQAAFRRANERCAPHNMCSVCPNSRRTAAHIPRLMTARDQALQALAAHSNANLPPLQQIALTQYAASFDQLITELRHAKAPQP